VEADREAVGGAVVEQLALGGEADRIALDVDEPAVVRLPDPRPCTPKACSSSREGTSM
jgi:hypothetical protein